MGLKLSFSGMSQISLSTTFKRFEVNSPSIIQTAILPSVGSNDLSIIKRSLSFMPAPINELPSVKATNVVDGFLIKYLFRSIMVSKSRLLEKESLH